MHIYSNTLTRDDLLAVADEVPVKLYGPNLSTLGDFHGTRARRISVSLRPVTDGERWRKVKVDQFTGRERRIYAVSWHGHYVFMRALLELDPNMRMKSAVWKFAGRDDFDSRVWSTAFINWGSQFMPQYAYEMTNDPMDNHELAREAGRIAIAVKSESDSYPNCPICGDPIDYCQGHGAFILEAQCIACQRLVDLESNYHENSDGSLVCEECYENA